MRLTRDFILRLKDPSLVLYLPLWKLDGASIRSEDAYGRLCTVTGAVWRPNGREFDGVDDWINITPITGIPSGAQAFTIILWINSSNFSGTNYQTFYFAGTSAANQAILWTFDGANNDGTLQVGRYAGAVLDSVGALTLNRWYQIALTYDGTTLNLYIDGIFDNSATYTFNVVANRVNIGRAVNGDGIGVQWYQGLIGETLICNRALTAQEVQHNYLATKWRYR